MDKNMMDKYQQSGDIKKAKSQLDFYLKDENFAEVRVKDQEKYFFGLQTEGRLKMKKAKATADNKLTVAAKDGEKQIDIGLKLTKDKLAIKDINAKNVDKDFGVSFLQNKQSVAINNQMTRIKKYIAPSKHFVTVVNNMGEVFNISHHKKIEVLDIQKDSVYVTVKASLKKKLIEFKFAKTDRAILIEDIKSDEKKVKIKNKGVEKAELIFGKKKKKKKGKKKKKQKKIVIEPAKEAEIY